MWSNHKREATNVTLERRLRSAQAIVSFELRKGIREDEKRRAGAVKKRREASREELGLTQLEDTVVDVLINQPSTRQGLLYRHWQRKSTTT